MKKEIIKDILKNFSAGVILFVLCVSAYLFTKFGVFCWVVIGAISFGIELYQRYYAGAEFMIRDVFWRIIGCAIGWQIILLIGFILKIRFGGTP